MALFHTPCAGESGRLQDKQLFLVVRATSELPVQGWGKRILRLKFCNRKFEDIFVPCK